ncbi:hypothetical protein BF93_01460 [Brachybacterium phenoliresistens]|uniref:Uncharacterized protein n=1 Tax=Brachybacterium phenoliresistens TaxID=396014 RepID=Z9JSJ2_9MICO|nr:DUF6541 family protein [Brachybacterium phenoliresistens]EWS80776.1 hypothetical protein BF93_01460 [Brachybacterium phenoliresistens]
MTTLLLLLGCAALVLVAVYVPGYAVARLAGAHRLLSLAIAPAIASAIAGTTAILAGAAGLNWSLLPYALGSLGAAGAAWGLRRAGLELHGTALQERVPLLSVIPFGRWWTLGAAAIAVVPVAVAAGSADRVLERWDALYHLSALQRIRETGNASSLVIGSISNSAGVPRTYPGAFHALASLVPSAPVPVVLNGAVLALAIVPWILGTAVLARAVFPRVRWASAAAAIIAALAPASPIDLWVHLSPTPNLVGFSMMPGVLAAAVVLWRDVLRVVRIRLRRRDAHPELPAPVPVRRLAASLLMLAAGGTGLALMHPNVAVMALILLAVLTGVTGMPLWRRLPVLALAPALALVPIAVLAWTPLASMVTGYGGGLVVPWWSAFGEIALGLLTVWPMTIGVVIAILWWPGLFRTAASGPRWLAAAWLIVAILYYDAAVDSSWNLSALFYRGQDRIALPLTTLTTLLAVPGLQVLRHVVARPGTTVRRPLAAALAALAIVLAGTSVPIRFADAAKNLSWEYPGRGRFLQHDEVEAFTAHAEEIRGNGAILASPFSGASHMYAVLGLDVYFPVAGVSLTTADRTVMEAAENAATDPAACRLLGTKGIGYIYQDRRLYAFSEEFSALDMIGPEIGTVVFETDHSRLIEIDCATQ